MSKDLFDKRFVHFMWEDNLDGKEGFFADSSEVLKTYVETANPNDLRPNYYNKVSYSGNKYIPFSSDKYSMFNFFYCDPNYECKKAYSEGKQIEFRSKDVGGNWIKSEYSPTWNDNLEYRVKPKQDAWVILKQVDGEPTLCWNFAKDEKCENRHIYFQGTVKECCAYIDSHNKFASLMKAWEEDKQIQFESLPGKWSNLVNPEWSDKYEYRIKPEELKLRLMTYRELAEWLAKGNGQVSYSDRSIVTKVCVESGSSYFEDNDNIEVPVDYKIRRWGSDEWIEPTVDIFIKDCRPVETNDEPYSDGC